MKRLRYYGEFPSVAGVVWRAEILQESDTAFSLSELVFPAESPLVIEWGRQDKEVPVCGSAATLKLVSPGDRTYADLYSIEAGRVRLDVYRDGELYWSGTMDTEFYEEPYEAYSGYEVALTFSDFGILDRLKYSLEGLQTIDAVVTHALEQSGINYTGIDTRGVSTATEGGVSVMGGALQVRSDNFFDEEGEPSTLKEALEGMLQPLALKMTQRAGVIYIYDINGLAAGLPAPPQLIEWTADSQTLGVDKVYNNVEITFSPYGQTEPLPEAVDYGGDYGIGMTNLTNEGDYFSYYPDYESDSHTTGWDYYDIDFTIFTSGSGGGLGADPPAGGYFHILPVLGSAEECSGVYYGFYTGGHGALSTGWPKRVGMDPQNFNSGSGGFIVSERFWLPTLSEEDRARYYLRVSLEICVDVRYNPFSGSDTGNEEDNYKAFQSGSQFVFVPAHVRVYPAEDSAEPSWTYCNYQTAQSAVPGIIGQTYGEGRGYWRNGAVSQSEEVSEFFFEYYDPSDIEGGCGVGGWTANRQCVGRPDGASGRGKYDIYESFRKMDDGEYIPYPDGGGWVEVAVDRNFAGFAYGSANRLSGADDWEDSGLYGKIRWALYKAPQVEIVSNTLTLPAADLEDVEYEAYINADALDSLSINTICGTCEEASPVARGAYYLAATGEQVMRLARGGVTDRPEMLLIGTIYTNYSGRHTAITGEAAITPGLRPFYERNQNYEEDHAAGDVFMLMSDVQDVITDTGDVEICLITGDDWEGARE